MDESDHDVNKSYTRPSWVPDTKKRTGERPDVPHVDTHPKDAKIWVAGLERRAGERPDIPHVDSNTKDEKVDSDFMVSDLQKTLVI